MRIDDMGIKTLPAGATHIYIAILHPDIQKVIKPYGYDIQNVYIKGHYLFIPRRDGKFNCLGLITF